MSDFDDRETSSRYSDKNGGQSRKQDDLSQSGQNDASAQNGQQYYGGQPGQGGAQYYGGQPGQGGAQYYGGQAGQQYYGGQAGQGGTQYYGGQAGQGGAQYYGGQPGQSGAQYYGGQAGQGGAQYYGGQPGQGGAQYYGNQSANDNQTYEQYRNSQQYQGGQPYQNGQQQSQGEAPRQGKDRKQDDTHRNAGRKKESQRFASQAERKGTGEPVKKKKKKLWLIPLIIILLSLLGAGGFLLINMGKIQSKKLNNLQVNTGVSTGSGYQTIVLYGVDSREGKLTEEAHSDTIILCSINKRTKEVRMVSVYRDTYLDNTNGEYRKATECYYFGGPERSINMLNKNLDLDVKDFMTVDFSSVIKIVDAVGGIDMDITQEEMEYINGYCVENKQVTGVDYTPLTTYGPVHLDGIQALAYCRIRYTDGWDFKRTERQRDVILKCYQQAKAQGLPALISAVTAILPSIATNMSTPELISMASTLASYNIGEDQGFPFEQTPAIVDGSDVVVPVNLAANVSQLHSFLYGEENYTPSQTVQEISNTIAQRSGIY